MVLVVKNLPANARDIGNVSLIPELRRFLEKGMATHSSILAWRITWTEEPGSLQSVTSKELDTTKHTALDLSRGTQDLELQHVESF